MKRFALLGVTFLAGCGATIHGPTSVGDGRYLVGVSNLSGTMTHPNLKMKALAKAEAFCNEKGKTVSMIDSRTSGAYGWTTTEAEVTFECIDKK